MLTFAYNEARPVSRVRELSVSGYALQKLRTLCGCASVCFFLLRKHLPFFLGVSSFR